MAQRGITQAHLYKTAYIRLNYNSRLTGRKFYSLDSGVNDYNN